jgi:prophage antirepressor-like protein
MTEVITDFHCKLCKKHYASYQSLWIHNKKFHYKIVVANVVESCSNVVESCSNVVESCSNVVESCSVDKNVKKKYQCNFCKRIFNDRSNKFNHEKICKHQNKTEIIDNAMDKKLEEFKNTILNIIQKNCKIHPKIHPKTLQKINNDTINITSDIVLNQSNNELKSNDIINITSDIVLNQSNNELKSIDIINITSDNSNELKSNDTKIIKSDDNKFQFDFNKNFLTFHDKPIKYFYYNDQVYFKGKDIATILEYENTKQAIRINVNFDDRIKINQLFGDGLSHSPSPKCTLLESEHPNTVFINESGFYSLILASKKPEAILFKKWVTSEVLPSIRKTGSYNLIDNYIEEDVEKYHNKDCVYIIHIKDNIYKYGNTSHIFKRLQAHKTNLNYNKIIKIFEMNNMNNAIKLETKIKTLVKTLNINTVYNTHIEIFEIDNNNLQNIIEKIDGFSLKINKIIKNDVNFELLKLENENLKIKLEILKLSK